jgi:ketosteroid isomerase-like protein
MLRPVHYNSLVFLTLVLSSCGPTVPPDTRASDEAAVQLADAQWSIAASRNDLDGVVSFYADDAVLLPPNAPLAADKKSIRESWAPFMLPGTSTTWKATKVEVAKSGELAYVYGTYHMTVKDAKGGPTFEDNGKIVEIWKKQADGKWKCAVDTYNSDTPLPPPPAK